MSDYDNALQAKAALLRATGLGLMRDGDEWVVKVNLDSGPVPTPVCVVFENVGTVTAGAEPRHEADSPGAPLP